MSETLKLLMKRLSEESAARQDAEDKLEAALDVCAWQTFYAKRGTDAELVLSVPVASIMKALGVSE